MRRDKAVANSASEAGRPNNQSSIMAATNPGQHRSQLRHLELHAFAVRDLIREREVELVWCSTDENPSDLLTKAIVSPTKFDKFARWIMGNRDSSVLAFFAGVRRRSVLRVFKSGVEVTRLRLK